MVLYGCFTAALGGGPGARYTRWFLHEYPSTFYISTRATPLSLLCVGVPFCKSPRHPFPQSVFPPLIAENLKFAHADLQRLFGKDFNSMTTNNIPEEFMDTVIDEETSLFENPEVTTLMKRIFVYGTLKNGQPNLFRLMDPGTGTTLFVGVGQTVEKYPLVIERSWNMPCLLHEPGTGWDVKGEIYDVDDEKMKFLDYFEDHPEMYTRTMISAEYTNSKDTK
uniref:Gamma-glutamylcyclotransferase family protein n=1 Tax=Magallana gigas TaxID=29159 RepID=A0A8W8M736_MAGGI